MEATASLPLPVQALPRRRFVWLAAVAALVLGALPAAAAADTFTVNLHGDHAPGACNQADCTLREAAIAATALGGDDAINLPSSKPYRLQRSSSLGGPEATHGDLDVGTMFAIGNGLRVVHPGDGRATINASGADDRAIEALGRLELTRIKLRGGEANSGGQAGGGVYGDGPVILRRSKVVGNEAGDVGGGVFMEHGALVSRRSVLADNRAGAGGGIFIDSAANMDIAKTTIRGNEAFNGDAGGIWLGEGTAGSFITASTIAHNETNRDGGALFARTDFLRIDNSTLTENTAGGRGGGIYAYPDSQAHLNGVTIARNRADSDDSAGPDSGGGIFADGGSDVIEVRNSLVVKNRTTADAINECRAPAPVGVDSLGGNLITATTDCAFFDDTEDIVDSNPGIGPLAGNGGPTQTIALAAGSPAINQADGPIPLERDQRGDLRQNPDIGAFERSQ
jgi:hypothetical protein